jgi:hypothetical protein
MAAVGVTARGKMNKEVRWVGGKNLIGDGKKKMGQKVQEMGP